MTELRSSVPIESLDQVSLIEVAVRKTRDLIRGAITGMDSLDSGDIPSHFVAGYREVDVINAHTLTIFDPLPAVPVLFVTGKGRREEEDPEHIFVNYINTRKYSLSGRILRLGDNRTLRAVATDIEVVDSTGNGEFYLRYLDQGFCITRPDRLPQDAKQLDVIGLLLKRTAGRSLDASVFPLGIPRELLTAFDEDFSLRTLSDVERLREWVSRENFARQFAQMQPHFVDIGTLEAEQFYFDWLKDPEIVYETLRGQLTSKNEHLRDPEYEPKRNVYWGKEGQITGVAVKLGYRDEGRDIDTGIRVDLTRLSHTGIENRQFGTAERGEDAENVELYLLKSEKQGAVFRIRRDRGYKPDVEDVSVDELPFWLSVLGNMHVVPIREKDTTQSRNRQKKERHSRRRW